MCNIVISKKNEASEPWILATNTDYKYEKTNYTFETLVKIAKIYGFGITIESTKKTN